MPDKYSVIGICFACENDSAISLDLVMAKTRLKTINYLETRFIFFATSFHDCNVADEDRRILWKNYQLCRALVQNYRQAFLRTNVHLANAPKALIFVDKNTSCLCT